MNCIDLHLDELGCSTTSSSNPVVWVEMANMLNTRFAVDVAAKKVLQIVSEDKQIHKAVSTLKNAKATIKTYGASESIMCIFNSGNMLSDVIGMEIPQITAENVDAVSMACCENIDATVVDAYAKVVEFFNNIVNSLVTFFARLQESATARISTIDSLMNQLTNDVVKIDAVEFSNDEVFGFTQPVFMERANALQFINDNLATIGTSPEELKAFAPYLKTLGYKVIDSAESLLEGDEAPVEIVPETTKEAEQTAPEPAEVLNPQPVLQGDPAEVVSTEEGDEQPVVTTTPAQTDGPADGAQSQSMAVFRWTPSNIAVAATAVKTIFGTVDKFAKVTEVVSGVKANVDAAIKAIQTTGENQEANEAVIEHGRGYASFVGEVIAVYNGAVNELADQVIAMLGKLADNKSEKGVEPSAITTEDPMGVNARYQAAEQKQEEQPASPEGGEQPKEDPDKEEPKGEQKESSSEEPAASPAEGGETKNNVETPENVPNDKPLDDPAEGVDPNGEPHPGKAPHVEPTETPEGEQPGKKAEPFLGDVTGTRFW